MAAQIRISDLEEVAFSGVSYDRSSHVIPVSVFFLLCSMSSCGPHVFLYTMYTCASGCDLGGGGDIIIFCLLYYIIM